MRYEIIFAPEAIEDLKQISDRDRTTLKDRIEIHLTNEPQKLSKRSIKRLGGISKPQYRLRIDEFRVFYDVRKESVEILAIVHKPTANEWLKQFGEKE